MSSSDPISLTAEIKKSLFAEGFDLAGIAPAMPHPEDAARIQAWVDAGYHGSLSYMVRNNDKRADVTTLVKGAQSVIIAGINYYNEDIPVSNDRYVIARYARGLDYHEVIKDKLSRVQSVIESRIHDSKNRIFVDSAQITEKAWAIRAGLGWRGRNSLIINKEKGSFFLLGEIVTDIKLDYDTPNEREYCGECRQCIEACPTAAINDNYTIDVRKCISYHSIEVRGELPPQRRTQESLAMIYGCDRCQEVCPWNSKPQRHSIKEFETSGEVISLTRSDWSEMSEERFNRLFSKSPLSRPGYAGMMHNVAIAGGKKVI